jgi:Tol biopolymer transport system component
MKFFKPYNRLIGLCLLGSVCALTACSGSSAQLALIIFESFRAGENNIFSMLSNGTNVQQLTSGSGDNHSAVLDDDAAKIAFVSERDGNPEIYVMNVNGSGQTRLTNNSDSDREPAWNPDGTKIAFLSDRAPGTPGTYSLYVMDADGSNQTLLLNGNFGSGIASVAWSPNGNKLVLTLGFTGWFRVATIDADGTNLTYLTPDGENNGSARWLSNSRIVFASVRDGNFEIYVMDNDGSNQQRLTNNPSTDSSPCATPSDDKILFVSSRTGTPQIFLMNLDGSNPVNLSNNAFGDGTPRTAGR